MCDRTTLALWIWGSQIWSYLPLLWALIPFFNIWKFIRVPLRPLVPAGQEMSVSQLVRSPLFFLALVLMVCAGAAELTMSQWSSLFAEMGLGVPKVVGDLVGPALFAFFMVVGRTAYGIWGRRSTCTTLALSGVLCMFCYGLTVFSQAPLFSLLGAAFCGLAVSLMWPGTLSLTAAQFPRGGTAMFGILAVFGNSGASLGPWLTGMVSDLSQSSHLVQSWSAAWGMGLEQAGLRVGLMTGLFFPCDAGGSSGLKRKTASLGVPS